MRLASLQRLLGPPPRHGPCVAVGTTSRTAYRPDPPTPSATHFAIPAVVARRRSTGTQRPVMKPRRWNHPPPSGLRAGTPDRRGKRGEVMATFAMITTEPTWSIGE